MPGNEGLALDHGWDLTPAEARTLQRELAGRVVREDRFGEIRSVAGLDLGFPQQPDGAVVGLAALVVLRFPELDVVERQVVERPVTFPYVPGLLSFRESPVALAAFAALTRPPDLLIVDGQGLAHRRRFGIACHLGVLLDIPSIGSAKSLLVGRHGPLGEERGATADLVDRREVVGMAMRTRRGVSPVYVSIGHRVDLPTAVRFVLDCCTRYRLPEPQRRAHMAASGG
jgi:deoxyribonuclease V